METYESQVQKYSKEELIGVLAHIDREKYPERYGIAKRRYDEIKDDPAIARIDPLEKYQTGLRRFWAMALDGFFIQLVSMLLFLSFGSYFGATESGDFEIYLGPVYTVWLTVAFGQTLGKRICGVKVVSYPDESRIGLQSAMMREIFPIAIAVLFLPLSFIPFSLESTVTRAIHIGAGFVLLVGSLAWMVLEIATMMRDPQRRAFHDKIAGTIVIKTPRKPWTANGVD